MVNKKAIEPMLYYLSQLPSLCPQPASPILVFQCKIFAVYKITSSTSLLGVGFMFCP